MVVGRVLRKITLSYCHYLNKNINLKMSLYLFVYYYCKYVEHLSEADCRLCVCVRACVRACVCVCVCKTWSLRADCYSSSSFIIRA